MKDLKFWGTPPELYKKLDEEFHFDYDPCPAQKLDRLQEWDGLGGSWGRSNYVNPPYSRKNGGTMPWIRKGIEESRKGKTVVYLLPVRTFVNELLWAGAEIRPMGRIAWVSLVDPRRTIRSPNHCALFILRGGRDSA